MRIRILFIFAIAFQSVFGYSQEIDTVLVHSPLMNKEVNNLVILPESYALNYTGRYPVLYLLHGYSGDHLSWLKIKPSLSKLASNFNMIIVCPDGQNSWYWDSPKNPDSQYETYVSKELVGYMDTHYRTRASAAGRAVTGLSMGGHGGFWLGLRHPDVFGAFGSMSGGVDILPFPQNWKMKDQLGDLAENRKVWEEHSVINQLEKLNGLTPAIIIDCGSADFFIKVNRALHEKMDSLKIPHDYIERPGAHTADYWENAVDYQILFFSKFFNKLN